MLHLRHALVILALALPAWPAAATESAPAAGTGAEAVPAAGQPPLSQAIADALADAGAAADPLEAEIAAGVVAFYEENGFRPVWLDGTRARRQMSALRRHMDRAAEYGLDPQRYRTPGFALRLADDPGALAAADVAFSRAVARFVTHLSSGSIPPSAVSRVITLEPQRPHVGEALRKLSRTASVALALARFEPPHPGYAALKAKLQELRARPAGASPPRVAEGRLLRPGGSDERVPQLRDRLGVVPGTDADQHYGEALVAAVRLFQGDHGLAADGIIGPQTLAALNGPTREEAIAASIVNLERWRWMPRDLGSFHVMVNVPEFMVRVHKGATTVHETRVVVGKPATPTPTFSHVIDHLVVNPYWNVPVSIVSNEMISGIRRDPYGYMARNGYQVLAKAGGRMRVVDPGSIDWWMVNPRSVRIRQVPGDRNALGRIKFMFPNQHSVYLHDTPSRALFSRDFRAHSHGCVRVDRPLDFAEALLPEAAPEWNAQRIERLYGGAERRINLDSPVPVHLAYFTLAIQADGTLRSHADIYGYDARMLALLGQ